MAASIESEAAASRYVTSGVALRLWRADGLSGPAPVAVRIPDALLRGRYGADYAARVRWLQIPTDHAGRPQPSRATLVAATRTGGAAVLSPQVSSQAVMLAATSTPTASTGTGTFAATTLKQSSTWQVSAQSGDFSWSYPMRVPPAPAGPSPALVLSYDSQSVDGETGGSNNQADEVGDGWSLGGAGFIERSYVSCSQDDGPTGPVSSSGDLCWSTDNATVSFAGHSGRMIKDSSGTWRLQADDATRVEHLVGAAAGCGNTTWDVDCWRLTTTDGTQYYFGRHKLPNWVTGNATTNSTWTVPVFGNDPGEPGYNGDGTHAGTFATEVKTQAWRWNLDYVVDPHGNSEAFYYTAENNHYQRANASYTGYVRGGVLDHIDYGMRAGSEYAANAASGKVVFTQNANGRCVTTCSSVGANATQIANPTKPTTTTNYFDTPWDQYCTASPCTGMVSPTFWSAQMLSKITTQVRSGSSYLPVDIYTLGHSFPAVPTGSGQSPALWLDSIAHTGQDGTATASVPTVTFGKTMLQNRVWTLNGLSPLSRYRINSIALDTGGIISIAYSPQQCTAATDGSATSAAVIEANLQTNIYRCFPQWWSPQITPAVSPSQDLFHKYVVTAVDADPHTGGTIDARQETDYVYTGKMGWRFNTAPGVTDQYRTWSDYAGYDTVEVRVGGPNAPSTQQTTDYTFLQGMDGDPCGPTTTPTSKHRYAGGCASSGTPLQVSAGGTSVTDSLWWAGHALETVTRVGANGGTGASTTPVLSDTISTPWASSSPTVSTSYSYTQTDPTDSTKHYSGSFTTSAYLTGTADSRTTGTTSSGSTQRRETTTTYEQTYGLPTTVESLTSDAGNTCTRTNYAPNTSAWLINYPSEIATVAVTCATTPSYPADAVDDTKLYYDGSTTFDTAPSKGDVTQKQTVKDYTGSTPNWITTKTGYDPLGRVTQVTDPLNHTTSTAYTPAGGGPLTQTVVTNPAGWKTTTALRPNWGVPSSVTDINGNATTATYDPLGRIVKVWLPNRPQASNTVPSIGYAYTVSTTAPNAVATTTLNSTGGTITSYALSDGLARPRQTQAWSESRDPNTGAHTAVGTIVTDTGYDAAGRVNYTTNPYGTPSVNPSATLFVPGEVLTSFDGAGRPTAVAQHIGGSPAWQSSYAYPGVDRTDMTPPAGGTPTSTYTDARGRTTKLVQYQAATISGTAATNPMRYGYNARGDMTSMIDQNNNQWTWSFNQLGERTSATDPDTGTTTTSYNADGTINTTIDGNQNALYFTYDTVGRKTAEYAGTSTAGTELAAWTYDPTFGTTQVKGQLDHSTRYIGGTAGQPGTGAAYTVAVTGYTSLYQPTGQAITLPATVATQFGLPTTGASYATTTGYGTDGTTVTTRSEPGGGGLPAENFTYAYTNLNNLYSFGSRNRQAYLADDTFTNTNLIGQLQLSNGTTEVDRNFYYTDGVNRLTRALTQTNAATNFHTSDDTYTYDDAGNILSTTEAADTVATNTQCYGYDHLQNLTNAWTPTDGNCANAPSSSNLGGPAPYWTSYTIDPVTGNRLSTTRHATSSGGSDTTDTYTYPTSGYRTGGVGGPHAVSSIAHTGAGSDSYSYYPGGQTNTRPGQTLHYDSEGRLDTTTLSDTTAQTSVYDADGNLLYQNDPTTGGILYLGDTQLIAAPGTSVTGVRTYSAFGIPIAERSTSTTGTNTVNWLDATPNNTVTAEVDALTLATTHRYFDPYGNPLGTSGSWPSRNSYLNATKNTFTGTTQLGARTYDPTTGRFLSVDSLLDPGNPQQSNGYSYANNNPTTKSDPTGTRPVGDTGSDTSAGCWGPGVCTAAHAARPHISYAEQQYGQAQANYDTAQGNYQNAVNATTTGGVASMKWVFMVSLIIEVAGTRCDPGLAGGLGCGEGGGSPATTADELYAAKQTAEYGRNVTSMVRAGTRDALAQANQDLTEAKDALAAETVSAALPDALAGGEANTYVYYGVRDGKNVYVGITNNIARRGAEHGERFALDPITAQPVTRGQARAIEQAVIARNPGFENKINSISPNRPYYQQAVDWGNAWLDANGYP